MKHIIENNIRYDIPEMFNEFYLIDKEHERIFGKYKEGVLPPYEVLIHSSSECNLKCKWCIGQNISDLEEKRVADNLKNPDNMKKLINDLIMYKKKAKTASGFKEFKIENISFSGIIGEPLVAKESTMLGIEMGNFYNRRTGLFTNGILMDESTNCILNKSGYVLISVDAAREETYRKMKYGDIINNSRFLDKIFNNINQLIEYKKKNNGTVDVNVGMVVNLYNYEEIYSLAKIVKELGCHYFRLKTDIASIYNMTNEQIEISKNQIRKIEEELNDENFQLVNLHRLDKKEDKSRCFEICRINKLFAAIGTDGRVYACNYHPSRHGISWGDALKESFSTIWENSDKKISCKNSCPAVCDPFKTRANNLLELMEKVNYYDYE